MNFFRNTGMLYSAFLYEQQAATVPAEYVGIAETVTKKLGWGMAINGEFHDFTVDKLPDNNKVMLALSGGLDSVYFLYKLIERGYDVTAIHIEGLNKSSAKVEAEQARKVAQKAGAKFKKIGFKTPPQCMPDNPFKNQLILSIMLDYGIEQGCYHYAIGSDWTTPLAEAKVGFTITDCIEVNEAFWAGVKQRFPQAELLFIDDNVKKYERLQYLFKKNALNDVSSCIAPQRFRKHWHDMNVNKYGIELMAGRCGSCYKCSMEYILLVEAGLIKKDANYYQHCWDILATSSTSHRPDLFAKELPLETRLHNLKNYGS